jgi:hypothetical protein
MLLDEIPMLSACDVSVLLLLLLLLLIVTPVLHCAFGTGEYLFAGNSKEQYAVSGCSVRSAVAVHAIAL